MNLLKRLLHGEPIKTAEIVCLNDNKCQVCGAPEGDEQWAWFLCDSCRHPDKHETKQCQTCKKETSHYSGVCLMCAEYVDKNPPKIYQVNETQPNQSQS